MRVKQLVTHMGMLSRIDDLVGWLWERKIFNAGKQFVGGHTADGSVQKLHHVKCRQYAFVAPAKATHQLEQAAWVR